MTLAKFRKAASRAIAAAAAAWLLSTGTAAAQDAGQELFRIPPEIGEGMTLGIPVTLSAETVSFDEDSGVALAEGNVELGYGDRTVRADKIRYDTRTGDAEFAGNVHYELEGDEFSFDRIVLNLKTELGVLYNGSIRIRTNNYRITSDRLEKTGKRTFLVRDGEITTCPCDPEPDWKFGVGRSKVAIDGYAFARDVTFRIRDVPVLWFPWAAFPVKLTRQSGFLLPSFSHNSRSGYSIQVPFYWAMNRWSDATFTLEAMSERGYRPEAEYRFVLNSASEGAVRGTFFRDRITDDTRSRFYGENRFRYGENFSANARWDLPSDDQYYVDLVEEDILRTARHVPSRAHAAWKGSSGSQALSVDWIEDMQGTPDHDTVQRLPEYTATLLPRTLGGTGMDLGGEFQSTYFYRRAGDREVRGRGSATLSRVFAPGRAVTFTPYLSVDLLGSLPTSDRTGIRSGGRVLPNGGATLETEFRREFPGRGNGRLVHLVSPSAGFRWVPRVEQDDIPLTDLWSRVGRQRQLLFSLNQRLLRKGEGGPSDVAFLEVSWAVDTSGGETEPGPYVDPLSPYVRTLRNQVDLAAGQAADGRSRSSDVLARFLVVPTSRLRFSGETLFDPGGGKFTTALLGGEWRKEEKRRVLLEYRTSRNLAEDLHGQILFRPVRFLGAETAANYSIRNGELTDGSATLTFHPRSDCWTVGVTVHKRTRPDETAFRLTFGLKGIGGIGM